MAIKKKTTQSAKQNEKEFAFSKKNYLWMLIGISVITIGFLLMIGGGSDDPNKFSEEIFSFRRITLAPTVVVAGYAIILFAIMKRFDNALDDNS